VFIGYSPHHKGIKCLHTSTDRVYISRDVAFDENFFPFASLNPNVGKCHKDEILLLPFDSPSITSNNGVANVDDYMTLPYVPSVTNPLPDAPKNVVHGDTTSHMHTTGENSGSNHAAMPENNPVFYLEEDKMDTERNDDSATKPVDASDVTSDHVSPDYGRIQPRLPHPRAPIRPLCPTLGRWSGQLRRRHLPGALWPMHVVPRHGHHPLGS
jgi:hypothetical protein